MATTSYGVNSPEAVKQWSKKLSREALKATYLNRFIGTGSDALVQRKTDLERAPGDRIRCILRMQLSGAGIQGDATLEGNEEDLTTYTDDIYIDQLRHGVRSSGKMSEQRVPFSVREEAYSGLRDWMADRYETSYFNQICGYTPQTDTKFTGNQAVIAPSSDRIYRQDSENSDQSISTADTFNLSVIDAAVEIAKTASPLIRPVRVNGGEYFVQFLHPYQVTALRTNTASGQWLDIQKAAMQGGDVSKNNIFTGALGVYNGVVLHESTRVTQGVNSVSGAAVSTVRRSVLCGAQSAAIAFGGYSNGMEATWTEELFDYGNQLGVAAGTVFGLKKTVYNSTDFGTIVCPTYAVAST